MLPDLFEGAVLPGLQTADDLVCGGIGNPAIAPMDQARWSITFPTLKR